MNERKGIRVYTSRPWELTKTSFLILTWIVLGIHLEIIGPTLKIVAEQTKVDLTNISTILMSRSGGYMIANLFGALFQNLVKKSPEGLLSISFLLAAIVVVITPMIKSLPILSIVFFIQGISQGVTDLGGTSLMLRMWKDDVATPLNMVHLGYGFGAVVANLLVKPFLGEGQKIHELKDHSVTIIENQMRNIRIPYSIVSFLCLIISIGHLIFSIREYRNRRESVDNRPISYTFVSNSNENKKKISEYSPSSWGNGSFSYGLSMSIIWIFYMFFLSGNDQTFAKFFFVYLETSQFEISKQGATQGMIIYWLSYSFGRLVCAFVTMFVPVHLALIGLWICGIFLAISWYIFVWVIGLTYFNLFLLGGFTGFVFSPTFPLSFSFINQRLNVNPLLVALLLAGSACGGMIFQKLGGFVLDRNRKHFPTLLISCVLCSIILFVSALIVSSIHQKRIKVVITEETKQIGEEEQQEMKIHSSINQQ